MKKSLLFSLLALLSFVGCNQSKDIPERLYYQSYYDADLHEVVNLYNLYGDVESLSVVIFDASEKFGELTKEECLGRVVYMFNTKGDVVSKKVYDDLGLVTELSIEYNDDSKPIKGTSYEDGDIEDVSKNEYDERGYLRHTKVYDDDGDLYSYVDYECDKNGNIINSTEYNYDGEMKQLVRQSFNSDDRLTEVLTYDPEGELSNKLTYEYDKKGRIVHQTYMFYSDWDDDYNTYDYTFKYDSKGNVVETLSSWDDGMDKSIYTFDEHSRCVESVRFEYEDDKWEKVDLMTYKYDDEGNVVRTVEYDVDGRWTEPSRIVEYEIEYR